jgi:hypothetical protein
VPFVNNLHSLLAKSAEHLRKKPKYVRECFISLLFVCFKFKNSVVYFHISKYLNVPSHAFYRRISRKLLAFLFTSSNKEGTGSFAFARVASPINIYNGVLFSSFLRSAFISYIRDHKIQFTGW